MKRLILSVALVALASSAFATPMIFTDRAAWEAAAGTVTTINFNGKVPATVPGPYSESGATFNSNIAHGYLNSWLTDSNFIASGSGWVQIPERATAFGGDFLASWAGDLNLRLSNYAFEGLWMGSGNVFNAATPTFFGIVDPYAYLPTNFYLFGQNQITLDNIAFNYRETLPESVPGVPEPSTIVLLLVGGGIVLAVKLRNRRMFTASAAF